ncbi:accessory gene regulator AgrC [Clostridium haemolyticum NCTC 8350]|uniref:Accessory gene regulator AgrC n=3 Tax=Clostridium haemolyticum TaxID=84025 RepID=A0ABR4TBM4_CLOHA|nr:accessory gene regulator AgrC [Clostridium haemolyticum NCTC 9693]KGN03897.1 accessory gene regulator AgrC [Clostridium haemolyticum NCTC 8350]
MDMLVNTFLLFLNFYTDLYVSCKLMDFEFKITINNTFLIIFLSILHNALSKFNNLYHFKIVLTFIFLVLLLKKIFNKDFFITIETCFFTLILMILSEQLITIIFFNLLKLNSHNVSNIITFKLVTNILIIFNNIILINLHCILWKYIKKRLFTKNNSHIVKIFFIIILTFMMIASYLIAYEYFDNYFKDRIFFPILILCIFSIYIALSFLYTNYLFNENLVMLKVKEKKYNQLKLYSQSIENLIDDISNFKHDYNNMIFMMNGFLENNDYHSLKDYFHKNIFNEDKYYDIAKLKKIKNSGIKGLLSAKISQILKNNIKVKIEIFNIIDEFYISEFDLCRILGIFLDNAMEATKTTTEKFISISFIKDIDINIVILNSCTDNNININSIFKKGYSSKGSNRGIGLFNVRSILNEKYPDNTILNTYIKDNLFIQDLHIRAK